MAKEQKSKGSATEQAESQQMQTGIDFNDLRLARNVIHIASQRGAFTDPKEYQQIGQLYTKLDNFISSVEAQVAESKESQKEDAESSDDATETKD